MKESRIKEARIASGLSISQAAAKWQFPRRTWEAWENGSKIPPAYIEQLLLKELEQLAQEQIRR